ncbi:MAG: DNA repair protein RecO [Spirochaetota bacterium]
MNRSHTAEAIVLKNNRVGEIHKGVVLLTPEDGLVRAIAHGAYSQKGKLRGTTNLFCTGTCYLYTDRAKQSTKITDFDVREYFSGIREDLVKFYTASLWTEVVLKTYATGGESDRLFRLLVSSLLELQSRPATESERVSVQFVWRFLAFSGSQPDLEFDAISGDLLAEGEPIYYSAQDDGFCSGDRAHDDMPRWMPGAAAYLRHSGGLDLAEALRIIPPSGALARIKRVLYAILEEHVDAPLNSLRSGIGIL